MADQNCASLDLIIIKTDAPHPYCIGMGSQIIEMDIPKPAPKKPKLSTCIPLERYHLWNQPFNVALWRQDRLLTVGTICVSFGNWRRFSVDSEQRVSERWMDVM